MADHSRHQDQDGDGQRAERDEEDHPVAVLPDLAFRPLERNEAVDVKPGIILESVSSALLESSRLLWLTESEREAVSK